MMRVNISTSEVKVFSWKSDKCPFWGVSELLFQVEEINRLIDLVPAAIGRGHGLSLDCCPNNDGWMNGWI